MKKQAMILGLAFCFLILSVTLATAEDKIQPIANFTDHQRIDELERTLTSIDRQISRLEDRVEKLDRDVSELKRKM